jgi:hypothetical protein
LLAAGKNPGSQMRIVRSQHSRHGLPWRGVQTAEEPKCYLRERQRPGITLVLPHFQDCLPGNNRGSGMKKLVVLATIAGSLICTQAYAQERAGSAAIGAVSGALILGPIGAVAGALVGYTAGPEMARGLRGEPPRAQSRARRSARTDDRTKRVAAERKATTAMAASQPPAKQPAVVAPAVARAPASVSATQPLPPVQVFD